MRQKHLHVLVLEPRRFLVVFWLVRHLWFTIWKDIFCGLLASGSYHALNVLTLKVESRVVTLVIFRITGIVLVTCKGAFSYICINKRLKWFHEAILNLVTPSHEWVREFLMCYWPVLQWVKVSRKAVMQFTPQPLKKLVHSCCNLYAYSCYIITKGKSVLAKAALTLVVTSGEWVRKC